MTKKMTLSEIMFHMEEGNKTFFIRDTLFEGKVDQANELYCSSLKKGHDVSLKQIIYNNNFFNYNILTSDNKLPFIKDLQDYVLSEQHRRTFLFKCVAKPKMWMLCLGR